MSLENNLINCCAVINLSKDLITNSSPRSYQFYGLSMGRGFMITGTYEDWQELNDLVYFTEAWRQWGEIIISLLKVSKEIQHLTRERTRIEVKPIGHNSRFAQRQWQWEYAQKVQRAIRYHHDGWIDEWMEEWMNEWLNGDVKLWMSQINDKFGEGHQ